MSVGRIFLLDSVIGKMDCTLVNAGGVERELIAGGADVALLKKVAGVVLSHKYPQPDVEFTAFD